MKKHMKNRCGGIWIVSFLIVFFSTSSATKAYQIDLSFDSLFPTTWYQKGLNSSVYVWHALSEVFNANGNGAALSYDLLLGRLAFAHFCINRMIQEGVVCLPEDSAYLVTVLNKIQNLLAMVVITPKTQDFVACADGMVAAMLQILNFSIMGTRP